MTIPITGVVVAEKFELNTSSIEAHAEDNGTKTTGILSAAYLILKKLWSSMMVFWNVIMMNISLLPLPSTM